MRVGSDACARRPWPARARDRALLKLRKGRGLNGAQAGAQASRPSQALGGGRTVIDPEDPRRSNSAVLLEAPAAFLPAGRPPLGQAALWRGMSDVRVGKSARSVLLRLSDAGFRLFAVFPERLFTRGLEPWRRAAVFARLAQRVPLEGAVFCDPWALSAPLDWADDPAPKPAASTGLAEILMADAADLYDFALPSATVIAADADLLRAAPRLCAQRIALSAHAAAADASDAPIAPSLALAAARLLSPGANPIGSLLDHASQQKLEGGRAALLEERAPG